MFFTSLLFKAFENIKNQYFKQQQYFKNMLILIFVKKGVILNRILVKVTYLIFINTLQILQIKKNIYSHLLIKLER